LTREAKHLYMKRYLDPYLPTKTLWWNLATQNRATSNRWVDNNASSDEFAFSNTFGLKVSNALHQINGMPLKFLELIFPQVLGVLTYIFNTILTTSIYPAA
jgi:hypothetical protein